MSLFFFVKMLFFKLLCSILQQKNITSNTLLFKFFKGVSTDSMTSNRGEALCLVLSLGGGMSWWWCMQGGAWTGSGTSLTGDPMRHWNSHVSAGLCAPQVRSILGKPRQWQMDPISIYLSICRVDHRTHAGLPPINLNPVSTTLLNQHISPPLTAQTHRVHCHTIWIGNVNMTLWNNWETHVKHCSRWP